MKPIMIVTILWFNCTSLTLSIRNLNCVDNVRFPEEKVKSLTQMSEFRELLKEISMGNKEKSEEEKGKMLMFGLIFVDSDLKF